MKILILTSRFGMGHYCAAEAIKEDLLKADSNDTIEIIDIMEVLFPNIYKIIYGIFNLFICRVSGVYNIINSLVTKKESKYFKKYCTNRIKSLIDKYDADLVVATWSACSRYASEYKEEHKDNIPLYTYITDITVHDGWITKMTDIYFVATETTKKELILKGIDVEKIIVNGIPVRQAFKEEISFEPSNDKKKILIMGGGLGLIPDLDNILEGLCKKSNIQITIITGKNKKMLKKIAEEYPTIDVIGYTNKVDEYMKKADLIITKPGGISTFEAIYTTTPLYIIKPFLSQEVGNAKFIEKMSIGKIAWENDFNIAEDIVSLINNDSFMKEMKYNMRLLKTKVSHWEIKKIYERNVRQNVDNYYSITLNDVWSPSNIALQNVE